MEEPNKEVFQLQRNVRLLHTYNTYLVARSNCRKAEMTSNLDTDNEELGRGSRKRVARVLTTSSDEDPDPHQKTLKRKPRKELKSAGAVPSPPKLTTKAAQTKSDNFSSVNSPSKKPWRVSIQEARKAAPSTSSCSDVATRSSSSCSNRAPRTTSVKARSEARSSSKSQKDRASVGVELSAQASAISAVKERSSEATKKKKSPAKVSPNKPRSEACTSKSKGDCALVGNEESTQAPSRSAVSRNSSTAKKKKSPARVSPDRPLNSQRHELFSETESPHSRPYDIGDVENSPHMLSQSPDLLFESPDSRSKSRESGPTSHSPVKKHNVKKQLFKPSPSGKKTKSPGALKVGRKTFHLSSSSTESKSVLSTLCEINKKLDVIGRQNTIILRAVRPAQKAIRPSEMPNLPVTSFEGFQQFDKYLQTEENIATTSDFLSKFVCKDSKLPQQVYSLMRSVMSDDLATSFNWKGTKGKKPFENTKFKSLVVCALLQVDESLNIPVAEKHMKDWLKYARKRMKKSPTDCKTGGESDSEQGEEDDVGENGSFE